MFHRGGSIQGVDVEAGSTHLEESMAQLGGHVDPDSPHLFRIVGHLEPVRQPGREPGPGHLRHALDLRGVGDRHDPRDDRLADSEGVEFVDEPDVVLDLEEELGDREVREPQLLREVVPIGRPVRAQGWISGCAATPIEKQSVAATSCRRSRALLASVMRTRGRFSKHDVSMLIGFHS